MSEPWEWEPLDASWCAGGWPFEDDAPRWEPATWPCEETLYRRDWDVIERALDDLLGNAGA